MLDVTNMGNQSTLVHGVRPDDNTIHLESGDGRRFKVDKQDHFYLTLRSGSKHEFVRVEDVSGDRLQIDRGQGGTTPQRFNAGACVIEEWCPPQLKEFIRQFSQGLDSTGVEAGTYCLSCATCIDVDSTGRITGIDKTQGCD